MRRLKVAPAFVSLAWIWTWSVALAQTSKQATPSIFDQLPEKKIGRETIVLTERTVWLVSHLELADGAKIITNGHSLNISVFGDLEIHGTAMIASFDDATREVARTIPPKAAKAAGGAGFDRGPNTDGAGPGQGGRNGGNGANGTTGTHGINGHNADQIVIVVNGKARGTLLIRNTGSDGQDGGEGGDGGGGGNGQQGGRAIPAFIGCAHGPGGGGHGGNGGQGGAGGAGGDAGNGGDLALQVVGDQSLFTLDIDLRAGRPGLGGRGGQGGHKGLGGFGGRGARGCSGRELERMGPDGVAGGPGPAGPNGRPGTSGKYQGNVRRWRAGSAA